MNLKENVSRIDCSKLELIKVSRSACLTMVASACEVYPKECLGTLCCSKMPHKRTRLAAVFPFQIAKRQTDEVQSESVPLFRRMLAGKAHWRILGYFHSHPGGACSDPSETDLDSMEVGDLEIIVRAMRRRRRKMNYWRTTSAGNISVAWGKFQFLIRGFVKIDGFDSKSIPKYRSVRLELE